MTGHNVLHALGFDAFGLPAEQYAVQTGQHPRVTTEAEHRHHAPAAAPAGAGARPAAQRRDDRPGVLPLDAVDLPADLQQPGTTTRPAGPGPIAELEPLLASGARPVPADVPGAATGGAWAELDDAERRRVVDAHRLAYLSESPVNWCPGLGTVLANEEVTADGRSERGNFPVFKRNLRQWMMRITAYADRLLTTWTRWTGRSDQAAAAQLDRPVRGCAGARSPATAGAIEVFTTRPDTLFGATFMVLAPEHPLVGPAGLRGLAGRHVRRRGPAARPRRADAVAGLPQRRPSCKTDLERQTEGRDKTGVFTGGYATNPVNGEAIPVFVADYVLMGYGTGAIMAVPGQDERDWEFATRFELPIVRTVAPPEGWEGEAFVGEGPAINSANDEISPGRPGRRRGQGADHRLAGGARALGERTVNYKLRDWLFSRQRYWGEPFPIVYDEDGTADRAARVDAAGRAAGGRRLLAADLRRGRRHVRAGAAAGAQGRLGRRSTLDLGDGPKRYRRETNTMPQWAGSCWYELRYLDPANAERFVDPEVERYWMGPQGRGPHRRRRPVRRRRRARGAAPAVRAVLAQGAVRPGPRVEQRAVPPAVQPGDDPGATPTPTSAGRTCRPTRSSRTGTGAFTWQGKPVTREYGKIGKSLKNMVTPGRHVRRVRRRHLPRLRDVDGPAGRVAAVGDPGGRRLAAVPAAAVAQRRRRGDRRAARRRGAGRRRHRVGCCTAPSTRSATTWTRCVQHGDRPADRAEQPRGQGRRRRPGRSPRRWC